MRVIGKFILLLSPVVLFANYLGPFVFGIWLAILEQWALLGLGVLAVILCGLVLKYALLLQVLLASPIPSLARKGIKPPIYFLVFLSQAYAAILMAGWCLMVFAYGVHLSPSAHDALIPAFGWSYGVAMAPWTYLVWHETASSGETPSSFFLTFFACVGYIAMALIFLLGGDLIIAYSTFLALMLMGLVLQFAHSLNGLNALFRVEVPNAEDY